MATPQDRGWGWPGAPGSTQEREYRKLLTTVEVGGIRLVVRREVARLFVGFLTDMLALGYRLDVNADDWGWANRDIRGYPGVKSNHAWALAIDINAIHNPMAEAHGWHASRPGHDHRGVHTDMPPETAALAAKWGLRWGANYTGSRKDAMHFEYMGRPEDVHKYPLYVAQPVRPGPAIVIVNGQPVEVDVQLQPIYRSFTLDDQGRGNIDLPWPIERIVGNPIAHSEVRPNLDGSYDRVPNQVNCTPSAGPNNEPVTVLVFQNGEPSGTAHVWLQVIA